MRIEFWIGGDLFKTVVWGKHVNVPAVGDHIQFTTQLFVVTERCWDYSDGPPCTGVQITIRSDE